MMKMVTLISDLRIDRGDMFVTINSDAEHIAIKIESDGIPKIDFPFRKLIKFRKSIPFNTDQLVTINHKEKEIYRSDKSLFKKYNYIFLLKFLFKNGF